MAYKFVYVIFFVILQTILRRHYHNPPHYTLLLDRRRAIAAISRAMHCIMEETYVLMASHTMG